MSFKEISISELSFNPFDKIGKEWFLVTAGDESGYNTMTASWGGLGVIWYKNVFTTVIRPNRHTFNYMENSEYFTISFFSEEYKKALSFCGSKSGRDYDKAKETGLTPEFIDGTTTFKEADMVFICKKLYANDIDENKFIDKSCLKAYEKEAFHRAYTGEILKVFVK